MDYGFHLSTTFGDVFAGTLSVVGKQPIVHLVHINLKEIIDAGVIPAHNHIFRDVMSTFADSLSYTLDRRFG